MLQKLLGANIFQAIGNVSDVVELRLRADRPLKACFSNGKLAEIKQNGKAYIVSQEEIDAILARATNMSFYSASDEMIRGYIPFGHFRIGVGGEGVIDGDKLIGVKNVSFLAIRIPHQIKHCADRIMDCVIDKGVVRNTLVVSPTGGGKTTLLRELARIASMDFNVVVIDQRYELCAMSAGRSLLDIGDVDVVSGVPKHIAYENCVRAMNPDIIVTDELFGEKDVSAICDAIRCGVRVFASVHGESINSVLKGGAFSRLREAFDFAVTLGKNPIGQIVEQVIL